MTHSIEMIPHFTVYFCEYCNVLVAVLTALDSADFPGNFDIKIVKIDGHLREKSPSEGTNYQAGFRSTRGLFTLTIAVVT